MKRQRLIAVYMFGAIGVLLILAIALGSGTGGSGRPQVTTYPAVIPETTKTLTEDTTRFLSTVSKNNDTFIFNQSTPELEELSVGDVFAIGVTDLTPLGMLRKVNRVETQNGQVIISAVDATLTEAIQSGTIHIEQTLTPSDVLSFTSSSPDKLSRPADLAGEFYLKFDDFVIYDDDGDYQSLGDQIAISGETTFSPTFNFDLSIQNFDIQQLSTSIEYTSTTKFTVNGNVFRLDLDKEFPIQRYKMKPIVVTIGTLPVIITPVLTINTNLNGELSAGIESSITRYETFNAGIDYRGGHWDRFSDHTERFEFEEPRFSAAADFRVSIGPELSAFIYIWEGPYINAMGYLEVEADPFATPAWKLYAGLGVKVGMNMEWLKREDFEVEAIGYRFLLAQAGVTTPVANITEATEELIQFASLNTSTIMVFDSSGSMDDFDPSGVTKLQAAINASSNILDIIETQNQSLVSGVNQIGVVQFGETATISSSLTEDLETTRNAIQSLYSYGATAMADGLAAALETLDEAPSGSSSSIILLSDGLPNIGLGGDSFLIYLDPAAINQQVLDLASEAGDKGVCIYTIGFGYAGTLDSMDEDFLRQISENAKCGDYYTADNAIELANTYVTLRHTSTGGQISLEQDGNIQQGQTVELGTAQVAQNQTQFLYTVNWGGSRVEPIVHDPQGTLVDANYPGATISVAETVSTLIVDSPMPGEWQMAIYGAETGPSGTPYHAVLSTFQGSGQPQVTGNGSLLGIVIMILAVVGIGVYAVTRSTSRTAVLLIYGSSGQGRSVRLTQPRTLIGRGRTADIHIGDAKASRLHAEIIRRQTVWYVRDLNSGNGTWVNGRRIRSSQLQSGDGIRIGYTKMIFKKMTRKID